MGGFRTPPARRPCDADGSDTAPKSQVQPRAIRFSPTAADKKSDFGQQEGCRVTNSDLSPQATRDPEARLWNYIWQNVESPPSGDSNRCTTLNAEPIVGTVPCKQNSLPATQPVLDIVLWRRRLVGKQPPSAAYSKVNVARGHYDVLGVRRSASTKDISAAYRRQVLRTHPDKGGDPSEFHRVIAAYTELSNASRRAVYDRVLDLFGRKDGTNVLEPSFERKWVEVATMRGQDPKSHAGSARAAHVKLLAGTPQLWPGLLARMQADVLEALRGILQGKPVLPARLDENDIAIQKSLGKASSKKHEAGITSSKSGYKFEVTWASLCISTGFTKSIAQVIDWQIAILSARDNAQSRLRGNETSDPLTEEELLHLWQTEPSLELTFSAVVKVNAKSIATTGVQDLSLALDFRQRLLAMLNARKPESVLQKEKSRMEKDAAEDKRRRKRCEKQLLMAVSHELRSRSAAARMTHKASHGTKRKRESSGKGGQVQPSAVTAVVPFLPHRRIHGKTPVLVLAVAQQDEIGFSHMLLDQTQEIKALEDKSFCIQINGSKRRLSKCAAAAKGGA